MSNMEIYNKVRECPQNALKPITAGRLKGKSDINPQWRIEKLTEVYGPVGVGWYVEVTKQWIEQGANNTAAAFCNINLYVKNGNEWSKPIFGNGGSSFIAKETSGLYTSDECFKMALTDAISVACKMLGFAADIYWNTSTTKYSNYSAPQKEYKCECCGKPFEGFDWGGKHYTPAQQVEIAKKKYDGKVLCKDCAKK